MGSYVETGLVTESVNKDISASKIEGAIDEVVGQKEPSDVYKKATALSFQDDHSLESNLIPKYNEMIEIDDDDEGIARDGNDGSDGNEGDQFDYDDNSTANKSSNGKNNIGSDKSNSDGDNPSSKKKEHKCKGPCNARCDHKKLRRMMNKIEHCTGENSSEEGRKMKHDKLIRNLNDTLRNLVKQTPNVIIKDFCVNVNISTPSIDQDHECKGNRTSDCEPTINISHHDKHDNECKGNRTSGCEPIINNTRQEKHDNECKDNRSGGCEPIINNTRHEKD
nr:MAG: hypothetical protein [Penaeus semisulcatus pemonivirus]